MFKSAFTILVFCIAFFGKNSVPLFSSLRFSNNWLQVFYFYSWWLIPTLIFTIIQFGYKNILKSIGLEKGIGFALLFAMASASPMLLSAPFIGDLSQSINPLKFLQSTLFAGFMEEYLFRGFLFGLLFRFCGWGFIPAGISGALIFGFGHIYQGHDLISSIAVFIVTAIGALWFSWLFVEWNYNLWVPIFLHVFMNLSWTLFQLDESAAGNLYSNIFRALTIAITVVATIRYRKKEGFKVNKTNLWKNRSLNQF